LNALIHNYFVYKKLLKPNTKMMVMIKASGYGNGSDDIAKLLEVNKVDYFGVAYADEGIELRQAGIKTPILVLNPEESGFDAMYRYDLEPEIYCFEQLEQFLHFIKPKNKYKIHIKLDTGMHRLGFVENEIPLLCKILKDHKNLEIQSIFSHLASSEVAEDDDFTLMQYNKFVEMYDRITDSINYCPLRHILNSGGISRHSAMQLDMVRLGIGLYGVDSSESMQSKLHQVQTLKASISQIKNLPKGETIGYNRKGVLKRDSRIATISIGYADGLLRSASNGNFNVLIHNQLAPIIGNIAMDMCMVDITDIPQAQLSDDVIIFGEKHPIHILSKALATIPYEVLTNISSRVKRVYFQE
jgi:Alr-MurF fusion protein